MAKKKTTSTKKKTVTRRLLAAKKSKAKKASAKKSGSKKSGSKNSRKAVSSKSGKSSRKTDPNSVDGILKKFVQERSSLDVHLSGVQKKIADLEKKTKSYQEQLVALAQDKETTLDSIAQIDTRRDLEVSQLLAKLGVRVTDVPPAATTTVVFDVKPAEETTDNGRHQSNREDRYSDESE